MMVSYCLYLKQTPNIFKSNDSNVRQHEDIPHDGLQDGNQLLPLYFFVLPA